MSESPNNPSSAESGSVGALCSQLTFTGSVDRIDGGRGVSVQFFREQVQETSQPGEL